MIAQGDWLLLWIGALLSLLALRLVRRLIPEADLGMRTLAALVLFVAVADLCLLGLGAVGLLRPMWLAGLVTGLWLSERVVPGGSGSAGAGAGTGTGAGALCALVGGFGAWWILHTIGTGPRFDWDDLAYHASIPAWWVRAGSLALPPLTYQSYYPANAELFSVLFVLPLRTDAAANLSVFVWLALVLSAWVVITRSLGLSGRVACAAMVCFLASPEVRTLAGTVSAVDLSVAGLGSAALALAWNPSGERPGRRALLCGIAAGLALGTKVSSAPLVLLVGVYLVLRARATPERSRATVRVGLAYSLGVLALGSAWYARNLLLSGNPVFPAQLGPFEGPFTAEAQRQTTLIPAIVEGMSSPSFWLEFLRRRIDWPVPLGLLSIAGYLAAARAAFGRRRASAGGYLLLLLSVGATFLVLFPFQPFSGTNNRPDGDLIHLIRYLAFPFALGLILLPTAVRAHSRAEWVLTGAALLAAATALSDLTSTDAIVIFVGAALAFACTRLGSSTRERIAGASPVWILGAWLIVVLLVPLKVERMDANLLAFKGQRPIGPGWAELEQLPEDARVVVLSNLPSSHRLYRPIFGRRLHLEPVAVLPNGRERGLLHETWRDEPDDWWWEFEASTAIGRTAFLENLRSTDSSYAFVSKWPRVVGDAKAGWPRARRILRNELPPSACLFSTGYSELWDLRPQVAGSDDAK